MALVKCKECKAEISSTAKACPKCGAPVKKRHSIAAGIFGGLLLFGVLFILVQKPTAPPAPAARTPEQTAADLQRKVDDGRVQLLKAALKNPASFKLVKAISGANGDLCVQYRGTNSFGAVTTESARFSIDGANGPVASCEGFKGTDVTTSLEVGLKYGG